MDYTLFRRQLIYKNRTSLEELADEHEEITFLIDNMLDNYYFSSADGKDRALRSFNTAYYLCTLILLCENRPEWYFARYCDIAYCGDKGNKVYQSFTISLVIIFLTHTYYKVPCEKLLKKMDSFLDKFGNALIWNDIMLDDYTYRDVCNDLLKNAPDDFLIGEEFLPRKIDKDIFKEVDGPGDVWSKLTNNYDGKEIRKIVDSLGKDEEEKHIIIELICRDAKRYYAASSGYYHETVKPMLDEMDELVYHEYNAAVNQAIMDAKIEELQYQGDVRPLQARIKELEAKLKNSHQGNFDNSKYIESLNRQLSEEKNKNAHLESENNQLRELLELDKNLESDQMRLQIDERIILITTALGTPWNSDLTNQTQLAKIIEHFSGDDWKSIRSRIVAINSEMKKEIEAPGEGLSQGTKEAINNVIGWLEKAMRGDRNTQTTDSLIEEIKDVFLNTKE